MVLDLIFSDMKFEQKFCRISPFYWWFTKRCDFDLNYISFQGFWLRNDHSGYIFVRSLFSKSDVFDWSAKLAGTSGSTDVRIHPHQAMKLNESYVLRSDAFSSSAFKAECQHRCCPCRVHQSWTYKNQPKHKPSVAVNLCLGIFVDFCLLQWQALPGIWSLHLSCHPVDILQLEIFPSPSNSRGGHSKKYFFWCRCASMQK